MAPGNAVRWTGKACRQYLPHLTAFATLSPAGIHTTFPDAAVYKRTRAGLLLETALGAHPALRFTRVFPRSLQALSETSGAMGRQFYDRLEGQPTLTGPISDTA